MNSIRSLHEGDHVRAMLEDGRIVETEIYGLVEPRDQDMVIVVHEGRIHLLTCDRIQKIAKSAAQNFQEKQTK